MFNSDSWQSHTEYHINFKNLKARFPSHLRSQLWDRYPKEREKLMALDLDSVGEYLAQFYSATGRPAKNQAQILRSFILFAFLFNRSDAEFSLTSWVGEVLPNDPVLIALIGCSSSQQLPAIGSYFDFIDRFWKGPRDNYGRSSLLAKGKNGKSPKKRAVRMANWWSPSLKNTLSKIWWTVSFRGISFRMIGRASFRLSFFWLPSFPL